MPRHCHADLIIAWANGAQIQVRAANFGWCDVTADGMAPLWSEHLEYRIKPAPKPDVTMYYNESFVCGGDGYLRNCGRLSREKSTDALSLTFDGETGKLKDARVLKS